jgi:hypothetical protein
VAGCHLLAFASVVGRHFVDARGERVTVGAVSQATCASLAGRVGEYRGFVILRSGAW